VDFDNHSCIVEPDSKRQQHVTISGKQTQESTFAIEDGVVGRPMTSMIKRTVAAVGSSGNRFTIGDMLGGLAAAAVALPQAMGLGVALFLAMGFDASTGAFAGLVGAASLSLISGLGGATTGMISAPNGPVTIFLSTCVTSAAALGFRAMTYS
jgi:MFS superfamily sulfate permease-like transporter